MSKSEVQKNVEQGLCAFCGNPLPTEQEKNQNLCSSCYNLRRFVKREKKENHSS